MPNSPEVEEAPCFYQSGSTATAAKMFEGNPVEIADGGSEGNRFS